MSEYTSIPNFQEMSIRCLNGQLGILDQRLIPGEEKWLSVETTDQMPSYIKMLAVRGAPMIGCAAALALAHLYRTPSCANWSECLQHAQYLKDARPTAVNLAYCCDKMTQNQLISDCDGDEDKIKSRLIYLALELMEHERKMCFSMSQFGGSLVRDGDNILTHCNTGSLATIGFGTALGVIRFAHKNGIGIHVYVDETRPLLQGARLTAYELKKENIPYTIICDNMAADLMKKGKIQRIFVGADRIATNGDFANKIGTYQLAVVAHYHKIPFHVVAPVSTIDFNCSSGEQIPIEQRAPSEVLGGYPGKVEWAPVGSNAYNPAFDVTPIGLVESVILDSGIHTRERIRNGSLIALNKIKGLDKL